MWHLLGVTASNPYQTATKGLAKGKLTNHDRSDRSRARSCAAAGSRVRRQGAAPDGTTNGTTGVFCPLTIRLLAARAAGWHSLTISVALLQPAPPPDPADDLINMMLDTDTAMLNDPPCSNTDRMYAQMLLPHEQVGHEQSAKLVIPMQIMSWVDPLVLFMFQGAVEMARWELNHGSNAQLRNISRGIITSSNLYIKQLQQALTHLPTPVDCAAPAPAPEVRRHAMFCSQHGIIAALYTCV